MANIFIYQIAWNTSVKLQTAWFWPLAWSSLSLHIIIRSLSIPSMLNLTRTWNKSMAVKFFINCSKNSYVFFLWKTCLLIYTHKLLLSNICNKYLDGNVLMMTLKELWVIFYLYLFSLTSASVPYVNTFFIKMDLNQTKKCFKNVLKI